MNRPVSVRWGAYEDDHGDGGVTHSQPPALLPQGSGWLAVDNSNSRLFRQDWKEHQHKPGRCAKCTLYKPIYCLDFGEPLTCFPPIARRSAISDRR